MTRFKDMALRFFNTYSREIEEFEPCDPSARPIRMYTCGPTVYSRAHIGNFRAYIFEDLLQRHLELRGYKVHRVMNITARAKPAFRCKSSQNNSKRLSSKTPTRCVSSARKNIRPRPTSVISTE
jgi:cysteinyl-tRNA synthetase